MPVRRLFATCFVLGLAIFSGITEAAKEIREIPHDENLLLYLRPNYSAHDVLPLVREWVAERPELLVTKISAAHGRTDEIIIR